MAFTAGELIRGAFFTWAVFTITSIVPVFITRAVEGDSPWSVLDATFSIIVAWYAGIFAFFATIVGALAAWGIGHALREQARLWPHLLAHGALAAVVGAATYGVFTFEAGDRGEGFLWTAYTLWTIVTVLFGWWATQALARRRDRRAGVGAYAAS